MNIFMTRNRNSKKIRRNTHTNYRTKKLFVYNTRRTRVDKSSNRTIFKTHLEFLSVTFLNFSMLYIQSLILNLNISYPMTTMIKNKEYKLLINNHGGHGIRDIKYFSDALFIEFSSAKITI